MARTSIHAKQQKKFTRTFAKDPLPPDADDMNDGLAKRANRVIEQFRREQGTLRDEALNDLLQGLMHLCDRDTRFGDFDDKLALAQLIYEEGTRASED